MQTFYQLTGTPLAAGTGIDTVSLSIQVPTLAIQLIGTFASGSYGFEVSLNGQTWVAIDGLNKDNEIVSSASAVGLYRFDVNGYPCFRLKSSSAAGAMQVYAIGSTAPLGFLGAAP
jgi:hypothetical protein